MQTDRIFIEVVTRIAHWRLLRGDREVDHSRGQLLAGAAQFGLGQRLRHLRRPVGRGIG